MLRVTVGLASRLAVPLAAWRSQKQIMTRHLGPIGLMQILALMDGARVVCAVPFNSNRPMVGSPQNFNTSHTRPGGPPTETGEQINRSYHTSPATFAVACCLS
ncbi:hypothetical protein D3C86_1329120 [compost metagenome]